MPVGKHLDADEKRSLIEASFDPPLKERMPGLTAERGRLEQNLSQKRAQYS
jgi:hypothetical protein